MQHQFWMTKQTLSQRFGKKEDDCITSSDALLDAKLELFRNIETSSALLQRIINKYQECICYLSQETSSMGRFLKENSETTIQAEEIMLLTGKSLISCAQQLLFLHEPLMRFYQELDTFRQRAIEDTFQNIISMEKARTEFRATLSWMKNASHQLDPDTSKQLEKFKRVQDQVRRRKTKFDKLSTDCLQKVELLAAARCNLFNHVLNFYQHRIINYFKESTEIYSFSKNYKNQDNTKTFENLDRITKRDETEKKSSSDFEKSSPYQKKNKTSYEYTAIENENDENNKDDLKKSMLSNCSEIKSDILVDSLDHQNVFRIDSNKNNKDTFLSSDFLTHSLKTATSKSQLETDLFIDKVNLKQLEKDGNTKSWLDLFEDLDPLTHNSTENSISKYKNSFV